MPFNPEEIIVGAEKIGAAVEKEGGVAKAAASIAAKGEDAAKTARTYVRDAKGRFASAVKGTTKLGTASALGAAAENALSSKGSQQQDEDMQQGGQGPSRTKEVPNPGAYSPAGRIDLPTITPAEDIASGVDPDSFPDTRGSKAAAPQSDNMSNRKLNQIINLLEHILSAEKNTTRAIGTGFRGLSQITIEGFNNQANRQQANDLENTSSGGMGSFFNPNMSVRQAASYGVQGMKGLAVASLGAAALGALVETAANFKDKDKSDKEKSQPIQNSANHDEVFSKYKDQYGKRWAQALIGDVLNQLEKQKGFLEDLAASKQIAAGDIYGAIKKMFDESNKSDQAKLVDQIATLLKIKPEEVEHQISLHNSPTRQKALAAVTGVSSALINAVTSGVTLAQKGAGLVGGGALHSAGSLLNYLGADGSSLQKKGDAFTDMEMSSANEANLASKRWLRENTSMRSQQAVLEHPNWYRGSKMATGVGAMLLGPGGKLKLATAGLAGVGSIASGEGKYDVFAFARQNDIKFNGKDESMTHANGRKLSPEVQAKADKAVEFFQGKGWSKEQAKAIVANLLVESNYTLDPHQSQIGGGGGYGIAQWTSKDRKDEFKNQEKVPLEQSTFEQQLDFVNWELNNSEKGAGDKLRQTNDLTAASKAVTRLYERPANIDRQSEFRASYARAISKQLDVEVLKPTTEVASVNPNPSPIVVQQAGTNISRNTTIQNSSAAAPAYLQDSVASTIGS